MITCLKSMIVIKLCFILIAGENGNLEKHVDMRNPTSFDVEDLRKLIVQVCLPLPLRLCFITLNTR